MCDDCEYLREEISELESKLDDAKDEIDCLEYDLRNTEQERDDALNTIDELKDIIADTEHQIKKVCTLEQYQLIFE